MNLILKSTVSERSVASLELIRLLLLSNDIVALSCFRSKRSRLGEDWKGTRSSACLDNGKAASKTVISDALWQSTRINLLLPM